LLPVRVDFSCPTVCVLACFHFSFAILLLRNVKNLPILIVTTLITTVRWMVTPTTEFDARDHKGLRAKEKAIIAPSLSQLS
jgi:hypothetical protein